MEVHTVREKCVQLVNLSTSVIIHFYVILSLSMFFNYDLSSLPHQSALGFFDHSLFQKLVRVLKVVWPGA